MPNLKIHVDETLYPACKAALAAALVRIRAQLCADLDVAPAACQVAVIPVLAMDDLPRVAVEMLILPRPDRTRDRVTEVGKRLQATVSEIVGVPVAVRVAMLNPATYVALK